MNPVDVMRGAQLKRVVSPVSGAGDNTAQVGQVIDHKGFEAALYIILLGAIADADATFTVLLEESDANFAGAAAVADGDMISQSGTGVPETVAGFQFDSDDTVRRLGYRGSKRFTRLTMTPAANTGAWLVAACCLLVGARDVPVTPATA